ncbi:anthranilate synthase component I family protein [Saprospiraceae bacterium]|nr:anthranilate synthase component I family protein [Saprospiraceae bacterium]
MIEIVFDKNRTTFTIDDIILFKKKAFAWAVPFERICYLDSNQHVSNYSKYEALLAVGVEDEILSDERKGSSFELLKLFYENKKDWLFGFLSYDLKNEVEDLNSTNFDNIELPNLHFFQPKIVIEFSEKEIRIHSKYEKAISVFEKINQTIILDHFSCNNRTIEKDDIQKRISKKDYLETFAQIKNYLGKGDIYEMNFCQEFYVEDVEVNPYVLFEKFNKIGKAPFAAFYKFKNRYLLCESPERFMSKQDRKIISQPIKGTIKRGRTIEEDEQLKNQLFQSPKERSENVMIVDLVRNDFGKSCKAGSVEVEELFGIHSFEQVHQMISTVSGELKEEIHFVDAIKNAYPMGSMTGAPKVRAMKFIEQFEKTKRGLYSGAVGYISPEGDFDFNVVIRSMIYSEDKKYLSYQTGGAIVYDSNSEGEYEECLLKAKGFLEAIK